MFEVKKVYYEIYRYYTTRSITAIMMYIYIYIYRSIPQDASALIPCRAFQVCHAHPGARRFWSGGLASSEAQRGT